MKKTKDKTNTAKQKRGTNKPKGNYAYDVELGKVDISVPKSEAEEKRRDKELKERIQLINSIKKKPLTIKLDKSITDISLGVLEANPILSDIAKSQSALLSFADLHQNTFKQVAEMQQRILEAYTFPLSKLAEQLNTIASFQNSIAEMAGLYQKTLADAVLNSGIAQISNILSGVKIEAFAGLYITSNFQERFETSRNGVLEVSTLKTHKLVVSGEVELEYEKNTQTDIKAEVAFQKVDSIYTKLEFMDSNLSATKQDVTMIKAMMQDERGLLALLQNNPFPYFKIVSIEFHPQKSFFTVNKEIIVQVPQYTMMENLCKVLFSGKQELHEEWHEDSILEVWGVDIDNEQAERLTWKQILRAVSDLNTLFARKTTKDDLILVERPKKLRLNPKYFLL